MIIKTHFKRAFSLIELLISLIVISCITAAFTPIITKKFSSGVFGGSGGSNGWSDECKDISNDCKLCFRDECVMCNLDCTIDGQYKDTPLCKCLPCTDKFGSNCTICQSDKCENCLDGSYLDNGNCIDCKSKFEHCTKCDKNECKSCETNYKLDNGKCVPDCTKFFNANCTSCDETKCMTCKPNYDLVGNDCIANCPTKFGDGCSTCSESACTSCAAGYKLSGTSCVIDCASKFGSDCRSCNENACTGCYYMYKLENGKCVMDCATHYGVGCTDCTTLGCLACASGYTMNNDYKSGNPACNHPFCSGSDFIQVGNLCVTRKNMGDSSTLKIPSGVKVVTAGTTCHSSNSNKCCWQGQTSFEGDCDNKDGTTYSTCNRTVCDHYAAEYICKNFKAGGYTWRLPTSDEMSNWDDFVYNTGKYGLQLCSSKEDSSPAYCYGHWHNCMSNNTNGWGFCSPENVWSSDYADATNVYYYWLAYFWGGPDTQERDFSANSVRCVTEL